MRLPVSPDRPTAGINPLAEPESSASTAAAIIPAYNEAKTIADLVARTAQHVSQVIVVDDASQDATADLIRNDTVKIIRNQVNLGKGESLIAGFQAAREAGYKFAVTLDGDGQHRPEDITALLREADERSVVVASRMADAHLIPKARYRANQTANFFISWAAGQWIQDTQCGFRVYPLALFDQIHLRRGRRHGFVLESEVLIEACRAGYRVKTVPIPALYGGVLQRRSHFRPVRDILAIVIMVTGKILAKWLYLTGLVRSRREYRESRALPG